MLELEASGLCLARATTFRAVCILRRKTVDAEHYAEWLIEPMKTEHVDAVSNVDLLATYQLQQRKNEVEPGTLEDGD